jgi:hypothetical protein
MAGLQPEIMIMDRAYQYGPNASTVRSQCIRKDLVTDQGRVFRRYTELGHTFSKTHRSRFFCPDDAGNAIFLTEAYDSAPLAVGNNTQLDFGSLHFLKPSSHILRGNIRCIGNNGVIKVQHQQPDMVLTKQIGTHIRQGGANQFR